MNKIIQFWHEYAIVIFIADRAVMIMIDSMDAPDKDSGKFYRWVYKVLNSYAANLNRAFRTLLPSGLPNTEENAKAEGFVNKP